MRAPASSRSLRGPRNQLTVATVALVLGILVVVQIRAQSAGTGLDALSAPELTVLVANLNTRNDQLRAEIASTQSELDQLSAAQSRGDTSLGQLQADLVRVEAWAGLRPVIGPGVEITVSGRIPGAAVEDLINELHNAGAEAVAVGGIRLVPGSVVAGAPGQLSVADTPLTDPFQVDALGSSAALTGTLTRAGGMIAQFRATFPDVQLTVTPVDRISLPATKRNLVPGHGTPRL
ncbi:MAG: DUF881 domain-containing protein [Chloroflexi bacterium]|nr:MAG: DUF881 domain-containing protein [Chloroflexota bacterium]